MSKDEHPAESNRMEGIVSPIKPAAMNRAVEEL